LVGLPLALVRPITHAPPPGVGQPPSAVFIVSDTLRADWTSLHGGGVPTPHLEAIAGEAAVFDRAYALAPWTLPSMTGLFESRYPPSLTPGAGHGAWINQLWQYGQPPTGPNLARRLAEHGYVTGAITANAFLPVLANIMDGFQVHAAAHPILLRHEGLLSATPLLRDALLGLNLPFVDVRPHDTTADLDRYVRAFIRRYRDRPFYLWIHYIDPHAPYDPPASMRTETGPWPFYYPYAGGEAWGIPVLGQDDAVPVAARDYVTDLYRGEIQRIDAFIGRAIETLDAAGVASAYVAITSDHGEELWDHGAWGHGQSLYEELVHVPMLFRGPGIAPRRYASPISAIDLMPTLAGLLGLASSAHWRGRDLADAIRSDAPVPATPVFAQGTSDKAADPLRMAIDGKHKLIRNARTLATMLFDLEDDPNERNDLAGVMPGRVAELTALLDAWIATFDATYSVEDAGGPVSPELAEQLRGMGYL